MTEYEEALEYIHSFGHRKYNKRPLTRTRELLEEFGAPDRGLKFVHVAGTNGKGSVCAMTESILRSAGYKTGMFTSPYIARFNERIRVNGEDIPDNDLAELVDEVRPYIDGLADKPTEFELVTVLGLVYFAKMGCDIVILEAGMGGRFDFTNVIDAPEVAVITSIGLEHTKNLGATEAEIAWHKAGIIKAGSAVVYTGAGEEAEAVIKEAALQANVPAIKVDCGDIDIISVDAEGCRFSFGRFAKLSLPLSGTYQPQNAAASIAACDELRKKGYAIPDEAYINGLAGTKWKGRFEKLRERPLFILDGAHNPPAAAAAARSLRGVLGEKKTVFLIGVMADKDVTGIVFALRPLAKAFVCVPIDYPRALKPKALCEIIGDGAEAVPSIEEGVRRAAELAGEDGAVCALGSLYLSKSVREAVKNGF